MDQELRVLLIPDDSPMSRENNAAGNACGDDMCKTLLLSVTIPVLLSEAKLHQAEQQSVTEGVMQETQGTW